jgi:type IV pilus assembly protein PilE
MQARHRNPIRHDRQAGFTLLELIIVVLVVTILAALAMSGYGYAMIKTRRAAAEGCLTESAQVMERFYTINMTYTGAVLPNPLCSTDVGAYYTVGYAAGEPTATTYKFQAVPKGPQAKDSCGTLSLDHMANKQAGAASCW